MSDIVLKDKNGKKNTYSGIDVINIADSEGAYNRYVAEPQGEIQITSNGTFDVKTIAIAKVNVAGGGSTECSGNHIIEVDTLPTENISETDIYKCGESYYKYAKEFKDLIIVEDGEQKSFVNTYTELGINTNLYYVDNYENVENPIIYEDTSNLIVSIYYDLSRNDVFGYSEGVWFSVSENLNYVNGGAITNSSEATTTGYYYALIGDGWKFVGGSEYNGSVTIEGEAQSIDYYDGTVVIV